MTLEEIEIYYEKDEEQIRKFLSEVLSDNFDMKAFIDRRRFSALEEAEKFIKKLWDPLLV